MAGTGEGAAADTYNALVDRTSDLGNRIRVSLDFLCNNSTSLKEVLVYLFSHGLLSQRESEVVENEKSNYDRFRQLFTFLIPKASHGNNSQHIVNAFQQSGNEHILERLLQSAIVTTDVDSRSVDTSLQSIRFNVRNPILSFFGRENFLLDLDEHILQSQQRDTDVPTTSTNISVVTGLGGIGKTETILKYIQSYGRCYQHVVWIDAEKQNTAENQFRKLAVQELQLPSKDIENKDKDFDDILKEIYDRLCTKHTLIVFDNAEALDDSGSQRTAIRRFLPKCLPPTHLKPVILLTSRQLEWPDIHTKPLPLFTKQESSAFIFRQLKLEESDANAKDAETLSETFGGLPLALQAAVAVILQESKRNTLMGRDVYTIQHLLSDYNQEKWKVLEKRPPGSPDCLPLMLLWKVSLDKIQQQPNGHLAPQILAHMAYLSPTNIPKDLLFFIFNAEDSECLLDAVVLLVDYSFVHNYSKHFSIHRMLQDVTLEHLEAPEVEHPQKRKLSPVTPPLTRITTALRKFWPTVLKSSEAYDAVHDNLVHVTMNHVLPKAQNPAETDLHFIEFIEFVFEEIMNTRWVEAEKCCRVLIASFSSSAIPSNSALLFKSSNFKKVQTLRQGLALVLREMGRYKEAVGIFQELLSSFISLEDQEDVMEEIALTKHLLAVTMFSQGEYEEAIKLYYSVIDLYSKLHGPTHWLTLVTKCSLAVTLEVSGRMSEAKTLRVEMLEVWMKDLVPPDPYAPFTKFGMAWILLAEGRYDDALEMFREVAEVWEREFGPFHSVTLTSNFCMALVLDEQGKDEGALRIYTNFISSYEKASAASCPDCLVVKNFMALIQLKQGKVKEAKEMLCHVLDIQERMLSPSHVNAIYNKLSVAEVLAQEGKNAEALKLYEEVMEIQERLLGSSHEDTLDTKESMAWALKEQGKYAEALKLYEEVLDTRERLLGSNQEDTIATKENIAITLAEEGRCDEALELLREVVAVEERELGPLHTETLKSNNSMAYVLEKQGKYEDALQVYASVISIYEKTSAASQPDCIKAKYNMALILGKQGKFDEAKEMLCQVLDMQERLLGPSHIDTINTMDSMAWALKEQGKYTEALKLYEEVLESRERLLGPSHEDTLSTQHIVAWVLEKQGKYEDALRIYAHVISSYEKESAASHPNCLMVKNNMALILGKQGKFDEAKEMLCQVLDMQERLLGPSHIDTINTMDSMAEVLAEEGQHAESLKLYEEVLEQYTNKLGPTHPNTLQTNNCIGWLHLKMGNFEKAESIAKEVLAARQATLPTDHPDYKDTEELYEKSRLRNDL